MSNACVPPDPTKAGAHWLERKDKTHVIANWVISVHAHAPGRWYFVSEPWLGGEDAADMGMRYLRPVLTPDQEDALHTEIDEMAAALITANEGVSAAWKETGDLRSGIMKALGMDTTSMKTLPDDRVLIAAVAEHRRIAQTCNSYAEECEHLRSRITELTTALDERASETQKRDWRVL